MSKADAREADGLPRRLAYQSRWCRETAPFAVCEKSRRIGISWADASERVIHASGGKGNILYMSYNKDMTETYVEDCAAWAKYLQVAVRKKVEETILTDDDEQINRFRIEFDSGKRVIALSSNPRVLRSKGKPGDIVILDEAAFCDDLEALLKAAAAVVMWGGSVRVMSTHNSDDNPFNELVRNILAGRHPQYALHRITLDDAIADGLARRTFSVRGLAWYPGAEEDWREEMVNGYTSREDADEELFCIPKKGGGTYFPRVLVESRMTDAPVLRFDGTADFNALPEPARRVEMEDWLHDNLRDPLADLVPERRHVFGMDFARSVHLSVFAPLEIGETLRRRCPFLLELHNVPHLQQLQILRYICDRLPRFSGGCIDATGNGSFLAEAAVDAYGSIIEPVTISETWYRERMPKYKAAYEDDAISIPRSDAVLQDHRAIKLVRGVPRLPAGQTDKAGQRHGDSAMGLALGWQASERDVGPIDFKSTGGRPISSVDSGGFMGGMGGIHETPGYM